MAEANELLTEIEALGEKIAEARQAVGRRFIGQERVVDLSLIALLCGGHGLLVGLPGLVPGVPEVGLQVVAGDGDPVHGLVPARVVEGQDGAPARDVPRLDRP